MANIAASPRTTQTLHDVGLRTGKKKASEEIAVHMAL